jgi:hypothetical protein
LLKNPKKISNNTHARHCRYWQCLGASNSMKKCCKHEPINELLGLIQWLKNEKINSKRRSPRALPVPAVSGMLSSSKRSCKSKSIHQLLGLIQLLKNEEKKLK